MTLRSPLRINGSFLLFFISLRKCYFPLKRHRLLIIDSFLQFYSNNELGTKNDTFTFQSLVIKF